MDIVRTNKKKKRTPYYIGGGLTAAAAVTFWLSGLKPAPPSVDAGAVWRDTVRRGNMIREVRGPGTLVPEQIRWITAVTAGRVEQKLVQQGDKVQPGTPLLMLTNPDVQLRALDAQRQYSDAQSQFINLTATLETSRLNQEAQVATVRSLFNEAVRTAKLQEELAAKKIAAQNEVERARDQLKELKERLEIEQKRLAVLNGSINAQLDAQRQQVAHLKRTVEFNNEQIASMNVRSVTEGVVQEFTLEVGQWVNAGAVLARVVEPGRLKAVLRIPETQAPDVVLGQRAKIDTRNGIIEGAVVRIDPAAQNGTVGVDVRLDGKLPAGARPDLSVDGTIEIERLTNVLYVGRPAYGQPLSTVGLFVEEPGGNTAVRRNVKLGQSSVNFIEILQGLKEGDVVILSDMTAHDAFERVRLK
ncbi:MAG TPA: HlyD family efflux transporter periplasmic adaptor subunit [Longimicrobiales bacterium]|nr:HlyD family efflux transporter periplasmic adaptor subunit [Longimicrobiales bacterium]